MVGSILPTRSVSRLGFVVPSLDLTHFDLLLSLRNHLHVGPMTLLFGQGRSDLSLFALDLVHSELAMFSRALCRTGPTPSALDSLHLGLTMLLRSKAQSGLVFLASGMTCIDLSLFVLDVANLGPLLFLRSPARPDSFSSLLDLAISGLPALAQNSAQFEFVSSACGLVCFDLLSPVPDFAELGLPVTPHSLARLGPVPAACGRTQLDLLLLVPDLVHPGSLTLSQASARLAPSMPALDFVQLDLPSSLRNPFCLGSLVPLPGLSCPGFCFVLPVTSSTLLGSPPPAQSCTRLAFALSALDFAHVDLLLLAHSSGRLELPMLACGIS